jgi:hypothetical protein
MQIASTIELIGNILALRRVVSSLSVQGLFCDLADEALKASACQTQADPYAGKIVLVPYGISE